MTPMGCWPCGRGWRLAKFGDQGASDAVGDAPPGRLPRSVWPYLVGRGQVSAWYRSGCRAHRWRSPERRLWRRFDARGIVRFVQWSTKDLSPPTTYSRATQEDAGGGSTYARCSNATVPLCSGLTRHSHSKTSFAVKIRLMTTMRRWRCSGAPTSIGDCRCKVLRRRGYSNVLHVGGSEHCGYGWLLRAV